MAERITRDLISLLKTSGQQTDDAGADQFGRVRRVGEESLGARVGGLIGLGDEETLDRLGGMLETIRSGLTEDERVEFGVELLDAARANDAGQFKRVLREWAVTVELRSHPDFDIQKKEFDNLVASGELTSGVERRGNH